jgi:DNA-binding CsgD family transcriptional regulator
MVETGLGGSVDVSAHAGTAVLEGALHPVVQPQCSLAVKLRRATESVVGRPIELAAIKQELDAARDRLTALTLEGEPGIGKTRLLVATADLAATSGFTTVAVTADEEIRGPFLLAQSIFASPALREAIAGTNAEEAVGRAMAAISGQSEPGLETLAPDAKLLRAFDLSAVALSAVASHRPLALLIDDLQWADDDTLRLFRYVIRTDSGSPVLLLATIRPDEMAVVTELVTLLADMERMGVIRRLKLARFTQMESAELIRQVLAGPVNPESGAIMHAQSEGVPFIVEELARTYREAGMVQQIDGAWTLAKNAERLVPSAVRTLIQRRAARLPDRTKEALGDAAVLGRSFSLRDLKAVREHLGETDVQIAALSEALAPAVQAGLLLQQPDGAPADCTFGHEQVREFAASGLAPTRRRAIHAAIVDMLSSGGQPEGASLALIAQHAMAAGDVERASRFSIEAARAALDSNAPEEVLRLVDQALSAASTPIDRLALLTARDDAYAMLRRPVDRLDGLAELAALAEALGDRHFELEVMLRRAAALRISDDADTAADIARRVKSLAAERGDRAAELAASLELGQDLLRSPIGESYGPPGSEVDLAGAEEAFRRAAELAEELGDDIALAGAYRELGVIQVARARDWFAQEAQAGRMMPYLARASAGEPLDSLLGELPIAEQIHDSLELYQKALEIYERVGDRRGVMSTVIAMAYVHYAPVTHLAGSARHIEEIRRLMSRMTTMTKESERAMAELQMVFGVQVYAQAKLAPDLALTRGEEAYRQARIIGERSVEFLAAGGLALTHLEFGETDRAREWLDKAAAAASTSPTPFKARQLETWRGMVRAAEGDAAGMREHLERAVKMATDQGKPAARCESLARLALESAKLGAATGDNELMELAERSAFEAKDLVPLLPGHPIWGAQADTAIALVSLARGDHDRAAQAALSGMQAQIEAESEDAHLEMALPLTRALTGAPDEAKEMARGWLKIQLSGMALRTLDEDVRVRWLRGPVGRELVELAGPIETFVGSVNGQSDGEDLDEDARNMLLLLTEGRTNREIAEELGIPVEDVARRLGEVFTRIGASSRAEATAFAFQRGVF